MSRLPRLVPSLGALALATVVALTGCSSGQVTQTSRQASTVNGASADVGELALRDIRILFPSGGSYAKGSTAQLVLVVVNRGLDQDRLVDVTGDFFDSAAVPTDSGTGASVNAPVPAQGSLLFGTSEFPSVELTDLSEEISAADVVTLTFVFDKAGEVTVDVPVANPTREIERGEGYDFHTEEQPAG